MSDWQPIETAPKDRRILLADAENVETGEWSKELVVGGKLIFPEG
jgi:hypothetical protein